MAERIQTLVARRPIAWIYVARIGFALALMAALTAMAAGFGTRFGVWHFRTGFSILQWGAI